MLYIKNGWSSLSIQQPSPNYDERPAEVPIDLIVLHNISLPPNEYGGAYIGAFFQNILDPTVHPYFATIIGLKVSAHFLIEREGKITQFVSTDKRAWHAGESCFQGRPNCNDFSIGIELEGSDTVPFTGAQYQNLVKLIKTLQQAYPAIGDRITGHSDIAPNRKTDPGPYFDWVWLMNALQEE